MARVDRLDEDLRQVLKMAAVIGEFLVPILMLSRKRIRELDQHLGELQGLS